MSDTLRIYRGGKLQPVTVEDGLETPLFAKMRKPRGSGTALTSPITKNDTVFNVAGTAGWVIGDVLLLRNTTFNFFGFFEIVSINVLAVTVDTPADRDYPIADTSVSASNANMAVNGSITPQVFALRPETSGQVNVVAHVTRIIFTCECTSAVDLNKFANLPALTKGLVLRVTNGHTTNLWNIKTNFDLSALAYDFTEYTASNPSQALDGFSCMLTFAGPSKMGVAIQVGPMDDLELLIQDDLSTLVRLHCMVEGHVYDKHVG